MKRRFFVLLLGLCMVLTPIAQALNTPQIEHKADDSFVVTYTGTPNTQYALFVIKAGKDLSSMLQDPNNVLYMDQEGSDSSGTVTFKNINGEGGFYLKSNQSADVYITGDADGSATSLYDENKVGADGSYSGGGIYFSGVTVSGNCASLLAGAKVELGTLVDGTFTSIYEAAAELSSDGRTAAFTFSNVSPGEYALRITKKGFLTYTNSNASVDDEMTFPVEYKAYGGDIDNEGHINIDDLTLIIADYGANSSKRPQNAGSDIDGDTNVNATDLSILIANYGQSDNSISQ